MVFEIHKSFKKEEVDYMRDLSIDEHVTFSSSSNIVLPFSTIGPTGIEGDPFTIHYIVPDVASLPSGSEGELAMISTGDSEDNDDSKVFVYDGASWTEIGDFSGLQGPTGPDGADGNPGPAGIDGPSGVTGPAWDINYLAESGTDVGFLNSTPAHTLDVGGQLNVAGDIKINGSNINMNTLADVDVSTVSNDKEHLRYYGGLWQPSPFHVVNFSGKCPYELTAGNGGKVTLGNYNTNAGYYTPMWTSSQGIFTDKFGATVDTSIYPDSTPGWDNYIVNDSSGGYGLWQNNMGKDALFFISYSGRYDYSLSYIQSWIGTTETLINPSNLRYDANSIRIAKNTVNRADQYKLVVSKNHPIFIPKDHYFGIVIMPSSARTNYVNGLELRITAFA